MIGSEEPVSDPVLPVLGLQGRVLELTAAGGDVLRVQRGGADDRLDGVVRMHRGFLADLRCQGSCCRFHTCSPYSTAYLTLPGHRICRQPRY